jgi:hypothetical protein
MVEVAGLTNKQCCILPKQLRSSIMSQSAETDTVRSRKHNSASEATESNPPVERPSRPADTRVPPTPSLLLPRGAGPATLAGLIRMSGGACGFSGWMLVVFLLVLVLQVTLPPCCTEHQLR